MGRRAATPRAQAADKSPSPRSASASREPPSRPEAHAPVRSLPQRKARGGLALAPRSWRAMDPGSHRVPVKHDDQNEEGDHRARQQHNQKLPIPHLGSASRQSLRPASHPHSEAQVADGAATACPQQRESRATRYHSSQVVIGNAPKLRSRRQTAFLHASADSSTNTPDQHDARIYGTPRGRRAG